MNDIKMENGNLKTPLMAEDIFKILPHKYPFTFIDKVLCITKDDIIAQKNITVNEQIFTGHFPGKPIFPGVLLIEVMSQACGILGYNAYNQEKAVPNTPIIVLLVSVEKVKFRRQVIPGDVLKIHARLKSSKNMFVKFESKITIDDTSVCEADIICSYKL